jgi:hypothetical protein
MNVEAIYLDDLYIDDEVVYTEEELDGIYKEHEEAVAKRNNFKNWCKEYLK